MTQSYAMLVLTDWTRKLYLHDSPDKERAAESFRLKFLDVPTGLKAAFSLTKPEQTLYSWLEGIVYEFCGEHGDAAAVAMFPKGAKATIVENDFAELKLSSNISTPAPMQELLKKAVLLQASEHKEMLKQFQTKVPQNG